MSNADLSAAEIKEWLEGDVGELDEPIDPTVGKIADEDMRELVAEIRYAWDRAELGDFNESDLYERMVGKAMDDTLAQAVAHGHKPTMDRFKGRPDLSNDISGYRTIETLETWIREQGVFQLYLFGQQGAGKTDFAFFLTEVFSRAYSDVEHPPAYITNVKSAADSNDGFQYAQKYSEMTEIVRELPQEQPKLVVLDEGSQSLTGSSDQQAASVLAKLLKLFRKRLANIIVIGHSGKDIDPKLRRLMMACEKRSTKQAVFGHDVQNGEVQDITLRVGGIPETNVQFDTNEKSLWEMDIDNSQGAEIGGGDEKTEQEELEERLYRIYHESDLSYRDIADKLGEMSHTAVRDAVQNHEERLERERKKQADEDRVRAVRELEEAVTEE